MNMKFLHLEEVLENGTNRRVCINPTHIVRMYSSDNIEGNYTKIHLNSEPVPIEVTEDIETIIGYCE